MGAGTGQIKTGVWFFCRVFRKNVGENARNIKKSYFKFEYLFGVQLNTKRYLLLTVHLQTT